MTTFPIFWGPRVSAGASPKCMACIQGYGNPKSWLQTRHLHPFPGNSLAWWLNYSPSWTRRFTLNTPSKKTFQGSACFHSSRCWVVQIQSLRRQWICLECWAWPFLWQKKMQRWQKNINVIRSLCSKVTLFGGCWICMKFQASKWL